MTGKTKLSLIRGDITQQDTEAIVNAANTSLLGGGGVDGAIHRAGGPEILKECKEIRARQGGCPTGEAMITGGGKLKARWVIHTVGPIWSGKNRDDNLLRNAYYNSLALAEEKGIQSIAFPSISTGAYRFPADRAARIALTTLNDFLKRPRCLKEVRFVLFSDEILKIYQNCWKEISELESKIGYKGKIVKLRLDEILLPDGQKSIHEIAEHSGAACAVPFLSDDKVVLVKQFRQAIKEVIYEIPAGRLEDGEEPQECIERELVEEIGYRAEKVELLMSYCASPGYSNEIIHIFRATGLKEEEQDVKEHEPLETVILSLPEVFKMIKEGKIRDGKTILGLLLIKQLPATNS
ncbi:O-acetyl-ADP-ribose deacetylase [Thermodesulfovibrionales bacterium]|nr:O-acetyl-ADP-ribose deacetylase [Thermodesulfovibrionales bacterium]MCL0085937.1 O-acetyl-ADP-ribose deacetylase [Thermodesulfovibrionales bacterium]